MNIYTLIVFDIFIFYVRKLVCVVKQVQASSYIALAIIYIVINNTAIYKNNYMKEYRQCYTSIKQPSSDLNICICFRMKRKLIHQML